MHKFSGDTAYFNYRQVRINEDVKYLFSLYNDNTKRGLGGAKGGNLFAIMSDDLTANLESLYINYVQSKSLYLNARSHPKLLISQNKFAGSSKFTSIYQLC